MRNQGSTNSNYHSEEQLLQVPLTESSLENQSISQDQSGLMVQSSPVTSSIREKGATTEIEIENHINCTASPLCCWFFPSNNSTDQPEITSKHRTRIRSEEDGPSLLPEQEQREKMGSTRHEDYQSRQLVPGNYHHPVIPTPLNPLDDDHNAFDIKNNKKKELTISAASQTHPQESTYWLPYPNIFDFLDAFLLLSCFRSVPVADADRSLATTTNLKRQKVSIKIEATVVKEDKDACRRQQSKSSQWRRQFDLDTKLAESVFVGIVEDFAASSSYAQQSPLEHMNTPTGIIRRGTLVTSFQKCATKARIVTLPAEEIIALSQFQDLDSGEVATIMSSYLPAFGALYHGIDLKSREHRFSDAPLSNCQVLISGGSAVQAEAVIKLALLGGASRVFAYDSDNLTKMNSPKLVILDGLAEEYESRLYQSIDLVVDLGYLQEIEFLQQVVAPRGRLVCVIPRDQSKNLLSRIKELLGQATLINHSGTTVYDFDEMCKSSYGEVLRDLRYLLSLTQKRRLRPRVDRYIKSRDVEIMQEDMAIHPPRGTVICEPWREFVPEPARESGVQERLERFCAQTLRIEG